MTDESSITEHIKNYLKKQRGTRRGDQEDEEEKEDQDAHAIGVGARCLEIYESGDEGVLMETNSG